MRCHHYIQLRVIFTRRHYGTNYTAKVTSTASSGRTISAEISLIQPLPSDTRGYPIPRRDVICKSSQILLNPKAAVDPFLSLQDFLSSLTTPITHSEISEILKSLNSPSLALRFFQFCPSVLSNFKHDAFTYTRIILILSNSTLPEKSDIVKRVLLEMEKNGTRGTISTVNILIGLFKDEDLEGCLGLMKKWGLRMSGYSYKCLVQAYLRCRDSENGFRVYLEMKKKGYKLDIFAYNMLLDALAKHQKCFGRLTKPKRFLKT